MKDSRLQAPSGSNRNPLMLILIALLLIGWMFWPMLGQWGAEHVRKERIERLNSAMANCKYADRCIGGFVRYRFADTIQQITRCGNKCGKYEVDLEGLRYDFMHGPEFMYDELYDIALPGETRWVTYSGMYEQQPVGGPAKH